MSACHAVGAPSARPESPAFSSKIPGVFQASLGRSGPLIRITLNEINDLVQVRILLPRPYLPTSSDVQFGKLAMILTPACGIVPI